MTMMMCLYGGNDSDYIFSIPLVTQLYEAFIISSTCIFFVVEESHQGASMLTDRYMIIKILIRRYNYCEYSIISSGFPNIMYWWRMMRKRKIGSFKFN